jgi:hypothetical protein
VQLREELSADAGAAVEIIGVLRYEKPELAVPLELDEREVRCVGLHLSRWHTPPRCRQASVTPRPDALGAAEVGDARVGADACPREGDRVLALDDPMGDRPDVFIEAIHVGFLIACTDPFVALWSTQSTADS